ncbi:hydantoinase B/oxoprolinase family protein [Paraburkholderia sp. LEh10]|uniref:hydantoinase B/oxoprolinase family protein n=1 Tax=Paraburkholderia sp. LEh10 TaxID=2821353 RepID=UPI001AEB129F|nr:hydantoinase B/oxoprolinase family protein [Paraburkholderia sp. LEh10]MBP0593795.1 hydantoinase B/oxoprolinase family protein [Paraburkholderia sp. LEh10]
MRIDNTTLQILADYCAAATEVMAHTLMRTAHSTFVKETEDFTAQLVTPDGVTFASPKGLGATWFTGLDYGTAFGMIDAYEEGDICVTNDPYSGYVATHSPDLHMWKPVFHEGELVCFVAGHVHNTDVGGAVPASLSRALTEVQQEGLRLPPLKICTRNGFNENVLRIIQTNVRVPEQNWGDLKAQIAAMNVGERRVHEIIARFGVETFREAQRELLNYAERQARQIVESIPDGEYSFSDYADEDGPYGNPCRVAVKLTVRGDSLTMDFTGSDPQLASSLNMPTGGNERHALVTPALILVLSTLNPHLVLNYGTARVARAILPEGTIMNAVAPAAVGMRSLIVGVVQLAVLGAFQQALPEQLAASPAGSASLLNVKTADRHGRTIMASIGPISGGGGGSPEDDGVEGCGGNRSFLKNTPVEINEVEVPIKILRYGLVTDSGGAGKYRGGTAMVMDFQVFSPGSVVTARNRNRTRFASWGVLGGKAGGTSQFLLNPGTPGERDLGNTDVVGCNPGDVLSVRGPGGGGWGVPYDRPVELVATDVRGRFVSREAAERVYGVVLDDNLRVDTDLTTKLRKNVAVGAIREPFDLGEARASYEKVWNDERYGALTDILSGLPVIWRHYVKQKIFALIGNAPSDNGKASVKAAYLKLLDQDAALKRSLIGE